MHFATKQWVGYDPSATHEAAGGYWTHRERQVPAFFRRLLPLIQQIRPAVHHRRAVGQVFGVV
jgi:hypothetical protein